MRSSSKVLGPRKFNGRWEVVVKNDDGSIRDKRYFKTKEEAQGYRIAQDVEQRAAENGDEIERTDRSVPEMLLDAMNATLKYRDYSAFAKIVEASRHYLAPQKQSDAEQKKQLEYLSHEDLLKLRDSINKSN